HPPGLASTLMAVMDIHQRDDLAFPQSLPEFQRLFPDDTACAAYLGRVRWPDGFVCPHCGQIAEPFRIVTRPVFSSAVRVAAKPASWSAPSWNAVIRRSASGSGPRTYDHHAIAESGDPEIAEQFMPMIHLVFSNLKTWLNGIHQTVPPMFTVSGEHHWRCAGGIPEFDWDFVNTDGAGTLGGRSLRVPRGRLVGGTSMV